MEGVPLSYHISSLKYMHILQNYNSKNNDNDVEIKWQKNMFPCSSLVYRVTWGMLKNPQQM